MDTVHAPVVATWPVDVDEASEWGDTLPRFVEPMLICICMVQNDIDSPAVVEVLDLLSK